MDQAKLDQQKAIWWRTLDEQDKDFFRELNRQFNVTYSGEVYSGFAVPDFEPPKPPYHCYWREK